MKISNWSVIALIAVALSASWAEELRSNAGAESEVRRAEILTERFAEYMKSSSVSVEKKAAFKKAIAEEAESARDGKLCCSHEKTGRAYYTAEKCGTNTYRSTYYVGCGIFWWDRCTKYRTGYTDAYCAVTRSKAERRNKKKRGAVAEHCSEEERVCCPGTVWYEEKGKCLDAKKLCEECDNCCE